MPQFKTQKLAKKGEKIYETKLKSLLEPDFEGQFCAIEPQSEDYFLGKTIAEAIEKAKQKYPDKFFHLVRVGYPAAVTFKHRYSI